MTDSDTGGVIDAVMLTEEHVQHMSDRLATIEHSMLGLIVMMAGFVVISIILLLLIRHEIRKSKGDQDGYDSPYYPDSYPDQGLHSLRSEREA